RNPGAVERRLSLAEQIGMLAAGGLLARKPLQGFCLRSGIADDDGSLQWSDVDVERPTLAFDLVAERPLKWPSLPLMHRLDLEPVAVEDELVGALRGGEIERRGPADLLAREVQHQVERHMRHPRDLGLSKGP